MNVHIFIKRKEILDSWGKNLKMMNLKSLVMNALYIYIEQAL